MYHHSDAVANIILSYSAEKEDGATITYDGDRDEYITSFADDDIYISLTFIRVGGLYWVDTTNTDESYYAMNMESTTTVRENRLKYTKRKVKRADEAMKLRRRLSFPADDTIPNKLQTIIKIPKTRKDLVRSSVDIDGKDRNSIRGKVTKKKNKTIYMESIYKPSEVQQHMNTDIFFFIDGEGNLTSVLTALCDDIPSKEQNVGSSANSSVPSPRYSRYKSLIYYVTVKKGSLHS